MDFPFEGIPTVPPRKNMDHMVRVPQESFCMKIAWVLHSQLMVSSHVRLFEIIIALHANDRDA